MKNDIIIVNKKADANVCISFFYSFDFNDSIISIFLTLKDITTITSIANTSVMSTEPT